ncbi:WecB/TagA/CpsF family glycosyltransferase [bacterium]|nr:WecB/TagA/CpsF family glycosyltransferase [bacterium]
MNNNIFIFGIRIDNVTYTKVLQKIEDFIKSDKLHVLVFANPEIVMKACKYPEYKKYINNVDLVAPDGIGLIWASKILGNPLKERVTGTDITYKLAELSAKKGYSLYFIGGENGVAEKAVENLKRLYSGVNIIGFHHGFWEKEKEEEIIKDINSKNPDILMVCLGMYKQEMWIKKNLHNLNVKICFGNGGALDFVSGKRKRAPKWIINMGLEWLIRLIQDPCRVKRQYQILLFIILVFFEKIKIFWRKK